MLPDKLLPMGWTLSDYANLAQIISLPLAIALWLFTRDHVADFWKKRGGLVFVFVTLLALISCVRYGLFNWLGFRVHVAVWILILASLVLVGLTVFVVWLLMRNPESQEGSQPNPFSYVNDDILGVHWSWRYLNNKIDTRSFSPFCPQKDCSHRLDFTEDYDRAMLTVPISLQCPRCGFRQNFNLGRNELLNRVAGEVERRINTKEFARLE